MMQYGTIVGCRHVLGCSRGRETDDSVARGRPVVASCMAVRERRASDARAMPGFSPFSGFSASPYRFFEVGVPCVMIATMC